MPLLYTGLSCGEKYISESLKNRPDLDCNNVFPPDLEPNCFVPNQSNFILYFISLFCYVICRPITPFT